MEDRQNESVTARTDKAGSPVASTPATPRPGTRLRKGDKIRVSVEGMASDGRGTVEWGKRPLKIEGSIPGETVHAHVFGRRKRTSLARTEAVETPSPHRTAPRCKHFGGCGGCSWQHITYEHQLELKRLLLLEALTGRGLEFPEIPLPLGVEQPWFYRNKMDFDFASRPDGLVLGLHRRDSYRTVLDIEECYLQSPKTAEILATARCLATESGLPPYDLRTHQGMLRNLLVLEGKASGQFLVQIVTSPVPEGQELNLRPMAEKLMQKVPEIAGVLHAVHAGRANVANPEDFTLMAGNPTVDETLAGIDLKVGPRTFLQRNTEQAAVLYDVVLELGQLKETEEAVDVYCGLGPISLLLAERVSSVTGIEVVPEMVEEARRLATERGVKNARFLLGTAEDLLPQLATELRPALAVVNPPRAGIHKKALRALITLGTPRMVYVSCSPASLADNLKTLVEGGYAIERIQPVDMLCQTPHLETVVALRRR